MECQNLAEADEAIAAGANIVMLDNIVGEELHSAAKELKTKWKKEGREFLIETSGGIVEGSLTERIGPGMSAVLCDVNQLIRCRHRHPLDFSGSSGRSS